MPMTASPALFRAAGEAATLSRARSASTHGSLPLIRPLGARQHPVLRCCLLQAWRQDRAGAREAPGARRQGVMAAAPGAHSVPSLVPGKGPICAFRQILLCLALASPLGMVLGPPSSQDGDVGGI